MNMNDSVNITIIPEFEVSKLNATLNGNLKILGVGMQGADFEHDYNEATLQVPVPTCMSFCNVRGLTSLVSHCRIQHEFTI